MSAGVRLRLAVRADAAAIGRVQFEAWRACYRGLVPDSVLDRLTLVERQRRWRRRLGFWGDGSKTIVAEDAGEGIARDVIGFASWGRGRGPVMRGHAEVYALYVQPDRQRRGIGCALLAELARRIEAAGYATCRLWMLEGNPAGAFYESLGGVWIDRSFLTLDGVSVPQVAYHWSDVARLARSPCAVRKAG